MATAEDNGIDIFYTDTDSMHLLDEDVPKLEAAYLEKYGKVVTGKQLGQFHVDFDLAGCKDVYSVAFIAVGKKCYVDKLVGTDVVTGEQRSGWHIRCKGVVDDAIEALAEATADGLAVRAVHPSDADFDEPLHRRLAVVESRGQHVEQALLVLRQLLVVDAHVRLQRHRVLPPVEVEWVRVVHGEQGLVFAPPTTWVPALKLGILYWSVGSKICRR
jgi:hypothetical protein